jgi:hypothetical protein
MTMTTSISRRLSIFTALFAEAVQGLLRLAAPRWS